MAALRFLAGVLLLVAALAAIYDGTQTLANPDRDLVSTSLGEHWAKVAPASLKAAQAAVRRHAPAFVWDGLVKRLLEVPTWAAFGVLGLLAGYAGRRRRRVNVFAN
jgi:hypothetical protein